MNLKNGPVAKLIKLKLQDPLFLHSIDYPLEPRGHSYRNVDRQLLVNISPKLFFSATCVEIWQSAIKCHKKRSQFNNSLLFQWHTLRQMSRSRNKTGNNRI